MLPKMISQAMVAFLLMPLHSSSTKDLDDPVNLSIEIDGLSSDAPPIFVYVEGRLSGIVPGIVAVPSRENIPVEIGIAGIKSTPLYSFTFGPDVFKTDKLPVTITNIGKSGNWSQGSDLLLLKPDTVKMIKITKDDDLYQLKETS